MKQATYKMTGKSQLLLSCDKLADPLDPLTIAHKELTNNKKKTEETHILIAKSQWRGCMYWDDKEGVYMPSQNVRATLVGGAKLNKLGMQIKRGIMMVDDIVPLDYGKKLTLEQLWAQKFLDRRSVVISAKRVMAYRPMFKDWSLTFDLQFDEAILDENEIMQSFENAGKFVGIGGFRPEKGGTFGRFTIEQIGKAVEIH